MLLVLTHTYIHIFIYLYTSLRASPKQFNKSSGWFFNRFWNSVGSSELKTSAKYWYSIEIKPFSLTLSFNIRNFYILNIL